MSRQEVSICLCITFYLRSLNLIGGPIAQELKQVRPLPETVILRGGGLRRQKLMQHMPTILLNNGATVSGHRKTALHLAAAKGLDKVVDMLLAAGAKLDVTDQEGWTPLHDAVTYPGSEVDAATSIVRKFCSAMSHDQLFIDRQNMDGETALHMAARFGHKHAVTALKPDLEIRDNDGWIPLHSAVKVEPQIVRAIINAIKASKQVRQSRQRCCLLFVTISTSCYYCYL